MIFAGMICQRNGEVAAALQTSEASASRRRLPNALLLNRTCPQQLRAPPPPLDRSDAAVRVVIGAGFSHAGLSGLSTMLSMLPGACSPARPALDFWTALGRKRGSAPLGRGGRRLSARGSALPGVVETRARYLAEGLRHRPGACSLGWELTPSYASLTTRRLSPPATCTALAIRHYVPQARVLLMLAEPVLRAHGQQTAWRTTRCYKDQHQAQLARQPGGTRRGNAKMAKGAPHRCERLTANAQLRVELSQLRSCGLTPSSTAHDLQTCASKLRAGLRAELPCTSNCPLPALISSHYALILPLWLGAFPCEQLLLLDRATFFDAAASGPAASGPAASGPAAAAAGSKQSSSSSPSSSPSSSVASSSSAASVHDRRDRGQSGRRLGVASVGLAALPAVGTLQSTLRFLGYPQNATAAIAAQLAQRRALVPPPLNTLDNPLDPILRAELEAYFAPFAEKTRKLLAEHRRCFAERSGAGARFETVDPAAKGGKKLVSAALARAG